MFGKGKKSPLSGLEEAVKVRDYSAANDYFMKMLPLTDECSEKVKDVIQDYEDLLIDGIETALREFNYDFAYNLLHKLGPVSRCSERVQIVTNPRERIWGDIVILYKPSSEYQAYQFDPRKMYSTVIVWGNIHTFSKFLLSNARYIRKLYLPHKVELIEEGAFLECRIQHLYTPEKLTKFDSVELGLAAEYIHFGNEKACKIFRGFLGTSFFISGFRCQCMMYRDTILGINQRGDIYIPSEIKYVEKDAYMGYGGRFNKRIYLPDNIVNGSFLGSCPKLSAGVFTALYETSKTDLISLNSWYAEYFDKNPQYLMDIFETDSYMFMFCLENGFVTRNAAEYLLEGSTYVELNAYLLQYLY